MISTLKPALALTLLSLLLCLFNTVEASPGYRRTKSRTSSTPTPTSCAPTATATKPGTLTYPQFPQGGAGEGTELVFSNNWVFIACSVYTSNSCAGDCVPGCCNKGSCGISSDTNLLLSPSPSSPYYTVTPLSPAVAFTFFDITFTTGYFLSQWPSVTIEISGESVNGQTLPTKSFIIPKPSYGGFYTSVTENLVSLGFGSVRLLKFLAYYTGSDGSGGQGPNGRVLAESRMDLDGTGKGIKYETYTPLGCERHGGYKRDGGVSVVPKVMLRRRNGDLDASADGTGVC